MKNLVACVEAEQISIGDAIELSERGFALVHKNGYALILRESEA